MYFFFWLFNFLAMVHLGAFPDQVVYFFIVLGVVIVWWSRR